MVLRRKKVPGKRSINSAILMYSIKYFNNIFGNVLTFSLVGSVRCLGLTRMCVDAENGYLCHLQQQCTFQ
jgi:hypothetical protein